MVYFIADIEKNLVKIGHSKRPYRRLSTLQSEYKTTLVLMKQVEGGYELEQKLHSKYRKHHAFGEWFTLSKVSELGFSTNHGLKDFNLGEYKFLVDEDGYFYFPLAVDVISKERINRGLTPITTAAYFKKKATKQFLESMEESNLEIYKGKHLVHKFVVFDMINSYSLQLNLQLCKFFVNIMDGKCDEFGNEIVKNKK